MVLERLYGQHYRAAQKFLRNRTLRKMNAKPGLTLYERIMAYRKLKESDEVQSWNLCFSFLFYPPTLSFFSFVKNMYFLLYVLSLFTFDVFKSSLYFISHLYVHSLFGCIVHLFI